MADPSADAAGLVQQLFDAKARTWSAKYAPGGRLTDRLNQFSDTLTYHVRPAGQVLDLGCGTGELARAAADAGMRVTACDISAEMLRHAAERDSRGLVNWVQLNLGWRQLPFEAATFDAIVAASVLEYVDEPAVVLRECARLLRPDGLMLCTVPDVTHPVRWLEWLAGAGTRLPWTRVVGRRWPRFRNYLTYLRISRHRRWERWWRATGSQAGLRPIRFPDEPRGRSPLRLLIFRETGDTRVEPI